LRLIIIIIIVVVVVVVVIIISSSSIIIIILIIIIIILIHPVVVAINEPLTRRTVKHNTSMLNNKVLQCFDSSEPSPVNFLTKV